MGAYQLLRHFPTLNRTLPLVELGQFPTPVDEVAALGADIGADSLWVKRDDLSGSLYGGNKVRKLELLFGKARHDHRGWVVTAGAWGSHHVLATALYGRVLGIRIGAVLCPQPPTPHVLENLLCTHSSGAAITPVPSPLAVPLALAIETMRRHAMMIPPGGSSPLGALAFTGAALELASQIEAGECPVPERIYVSLGSSGSMAGLLVGIALCGLPTKVVGVRVTDRYMANELSVAHLANRAARLLQRLAPEAPKVRFKGKDISVIHDQFGEGYGQATKEGSEAELLAMERAGLLLDPTYTGKAMAGLISDMHHSPCSGPVLFWSTLSSVDLSDLLKRSSPRGLPESLHTLFRQPSPQV